MKIEILGICDTTKEAWELSRPNDKSPDMQAVKQLDLPINEFFSLHLSIQSSILIREIFSSKNNHIMWAQTSRVQNILEFEIDSSVSEYHKSRIEEIRKEMIEKSDSGVRQDDYRLNLPVMSLTEYSIVIPIRNLIKLSKYFWYLFEKTNNRVFLEAHVASEEIYKKLGWVEAAQDYKMNKILNENYIHTDCATKNGNFITVSTELPLYLRAQLVRHRGVDVTDDLYSTLVNPFVTPEYLTISEKIRCQVSGTIDAFQEILSKRACWVAQYNIWSDLLNKISSIVPEIKLPCSGGSCPYNEDAMLRYEGYDPNPPCPIHCKLNDLKVTLDQRERMYNMIKSDNRNTLIWGDYVRATDLIK